MAISPAGSAASSDAVAALTRALTASTDPLARWRQTLATDPANAVVVFSGDSTSDNSTSAQYMIDRLQTLHTQQGEALYGMTGDDSHIVGGGNNGLALSTYMANPSAAYPYNYDTLVAAEPDLVVASWGINDVRLGATTQAQMRARLITFVDGLKADLPNTDVVLRVPNPFLTSNVSSLNYVQDSGGTVNPAGAAQSYSTLLRQAYLSLEGYWPHVLVADVQAAVFGTQCLSTHPLMSDQLHPSPRSSTIGSVPYQGGYVAIADYLASVIGVKRNGFPVDVNSFRYRQEFLVVSGGSAFLDLGAKYTLDAAAAQAPITTSDSLYVSGFAGPVSLASASITRPFGGTNIRISGLTGNDFTSYVGKVAVVAGAHARETTGDRQIVSVDLASISAGATATATATVTGARTGALHDATSVVCAPPASFVSAGLLLLNCYPSANDTVTLVVNNPTGGAVDLAAANFSFWVVR